MGREGTRNAAKKFKNTQPGPWMEWDGTLFERVVRFIEAYVMVPTGPGKGNTMVLLPFQRDFLKNVCSGDYSQAVLKLPRKQGKTGVLAALTLAIAHLSEGAECPLGAVTVGQLMRSSGLFGVMKAMTEMNDELGDRSIINTNLSNPRILTLSGSTIYPVSTKNEGSMQGMNPTLGVLDELAHLDPEDWTAFTMGQGAQEFSVICGITTPGKPNSALTMLETQVAEGPESHAGLYWKSYQAPEGCAIDDEEAWRIASPVLQEGPEEWKASLLKTLRANVRMPQYLFRMYHLAQAQDFGSQDCFLGPNAPTMWDDLADQNYEFDPELPVYGGLDVSQYFDSTGCIFVQERTDGKGWHAVSRIWFPGQGTVDQAEVRQYVRDMCSRFRVAAVGFDPRLFLGSAQDLESEGYPMLEIPQSPARLVPIIGELYRIIVDGELTHDGNPAFRQQILNSVARPSESGFTLKKRDGRKTYRIDAAVSLAFALSVRGVYVPSPDAKWIA